MAYQVADLTNGPFSEEFETEEQARQCLNEEVTQYLDGDTEHLIQLANDEDLNPEPSNDDYNYIMRIRAGEDPKEVAKERIEAFLLIINTETGEEI